MRCGYGAILSILAIGASTVPGWALDIPYSQGVVSVNAGRTVTVGVGGDYEDCRDAVKSFPRGGAGGVIEFLPGDHVTSCGGVAGRGTLMITGRLGPNGERPRVTTPESIDANGRLKKSVFVGFAPEAQDYFIVQNLEIYDTESAIDARDFGGVLIRNVKIDGTRGESGIAARQPTLSGAFPMWMEIYDSEVAHAGSGNTRHNLYLNRIDRVYIDGLYSHSANNSHALKMVARDVTVINSTLATTDKAFANIRPDDNYLSTTLLDMAACATSRIENNNFVGVNIKPQDRTVTGWGSSPPVMLDVRRRKTHVQGCDDPPVDSALHADPQFWADAAAGGYTKSNPELLHHTVTGNTFINTGINPIDSIWNKGTGPRVDDGKSFTNFREDRPLPEGWFERSVVWAENNSRLGTVDWGREFEPHADYSGPAPIYNLDLYDVVGVTPGVPGLGPTMSNIQLTLTQSGQLPQARQSAGTATALVSVSDPPALWLFGTIVGCFGLASLVAGRRNGS